MQNIIDVKSVEMPKSVQAPSDRNDRLAKIAVLGCSALAGLASAAANFAFTAGIIAPGGLLIAAKIMIIISTVGIFCYAIAKITDKLAPYLPRPLALVANVIHAIITEVFSLLTMAALYFFKTAKNNPNAEDLKKQAGSNTQPVLLIHGLYHNSSAWHQFIKRFKDKKAGPVFTIDLGNMFGSIETHIKTVEKKIEEIKKLTGKDTISLVGHSMGGVIATRFALNDDAAMKVSKVVSIGSPLSGTYGAYLGIGKSAKEMRINSAFTKKLTKDIQDNKTGTQFFRIASQTDEMVFPYKNSLLPNLPAAKTMTVPNLGHAGLLYSDRIIDETVDFVTS